MDQQAMLMERVGDGILQVAEMQVLAILKIQTC